MPPEQSTTTFMLVSMGPKGEGTQEISGSHPPPDRRPDPSFPPPPVILSRAKDPSALAHPTGLFARLSMTNPRAPREGWSNKPRLSGPGIFGFFRAPCCPWADILDDHPARSPL